ncbi:hypothetical protein N1851_018377 [Merluccius polli]|uniref:HECT-type E3 ubiquitin transferase n=1 Tax=Merluccius polli TaxID=89951 RepID=A0AA47NYG4_MERPO|nr:hypothetical protein N1851_018377 [Merluccius polli]
MLLPHRYLLLPMQLPHQYLLMPHRHLLLPHRNVPAFYGGGKRKRKSSPVPVSVRYMELQFCLLSSNDEHTPKDEVLLLQAGLGRRTINVPENADHNDENLDMTPLPHNALEFEKMPKHPCMACGDDIPLPLLPHHITSCRKDEPDIDDEDDVIPVVSLNKILNPKLLELAPCMAASAIAWRNIADPGLAADSYREALLLGKGDERMLRVKLDMADDEEDREGQIISFYKAPNVDWARPFQAKFQGDVAIGDGVTRHFLSLVNHKLQHGFSVDVGNSCGAMLFEGQPDHLVPSTSKIFIQNDMFVMAGRMIGHAFLHSGPRLTGLSPAVLHVLAGGTPQTATIVLEDITDIDVRNTITPLYEVCERENANIGSLSAEQRDAINKLAVDMDYAILKDANSKWLLHNILQDAVSPHLTRGAEKAHKVLVGWEIPMVDMKVEVVDAYPTAYPTASTCFRTIRIPNYQTFEQFRKGLDICLNSSEFGFGLL